MPKDADRRDVTRDENEQKKFETFFTTSVAQVPEEMINPSRQPDRKHGLLARFFGRLEKARGNPPPDEPEEVFWAETPIAPTGEIMLDRAAPEKADGSLELAARPSLEDLTRELEADRPAAETPPPEPQQPETPAPAPARTAQPVPAGPAKPEPVRLEPEKPEPAEPEPLRLEEPPVQSAPAPEPEQRPKPEPKPEPRPAPAARTGTSNAARPAAASQPARAKPAPNRDKPHKKQARRPDAEDKELEELKVMLETMGPQPVKAPPKPEEDKEITQQVSGFHFFGVGEDEAPRGETPPPSLDDTMSIELHEEEPAPEAPAPTPATQDAPEAAESHAAPAHAATRRRGKKARAKPAAEPERLPEQEAVPAQEPAPAAPAAAETEPASAPEETAAADTPQTPEESAQALGQTVASLNLRCALSGILAAALLWAGLVYEGILPAMAGLSPAVAPAAFMGANLLLLAGALAVSYSVLRDGLLGLVKAPSYETMPALAGAAALVQAVVALLNPDAYQATTLTLMSGAAALALFMANLGNRLLAASVQDGYKLAASGVEHEGAYRAKDKDLIRCLAPTLEEKDPWILLSRPVEGDGGFLAQSFGPRAGEKRAQLLARILLGMRRRGALCGCWPPAKGVNGAAAALAAILCLGAPLSAHPHRGPDRPAHRAHRRCGWGPSSRAWPGIEELNGIDTVQVDAGRAVHPRERPAGGHPHLQGRPDRPRHPLRRQRPEPGLQHPEPAVPHHHR